MRLKMWKISVKKKKVNTKGDSDRCYTHTHTAQRGNRKEEVQQPPPLSPPCTQMFRHPLSPPPPCSRYSWDCCGGKNHTVSPTTTTKPPEHTRGNGGCSRGLTSEAKNSVSPSLFYCDGSHCHDAAFTTDSVTQTRGE